MRGWPLAAIVYTDIDRDGMMDGRELRADGGGVGCGRRAGHCIRRGRELGGRSQCKEIGCAGAIIGRAYYEGRMDLAEAVRSRVEH